MQQSLVLSFLKVLFIPLVQTAEVLCNTGSMGYCGISALVEGVKEREVKPSAISLSECIASA